MTGIALMTLLGFGAMYVNSGAGVFFVFAATAGARFERPRHGFIAIASILAVMVVSFLLSPIPLAYRGLVYLPVIVVTPLVGSITILEAERYRSDAKLRLAQEDIEGLARIAERERIARDLHDLLGHTLSMITLKSELAGRLIDHDADAAKREITEIERVSRQALSEVRAAVTGYRSTGLMAEISSAKLALESAGVSFAFKGDITHLRPTEESILSLIVREAITNIVRHAKASRCFIELSHNEQATTLQISDNGVSIQGHTAGNGLNGIRKRVEQLGGSLTVVALQGTRLIITIPLHPEDTAIIPSQLKAQTT